MLIIAVLCLWICVWNTGGHVETNANRGVVVIMSDGNKPATFDLAKFVSSFGERSLLGNEKWQLIVLQRGRDGDRFCFNGSLIQKNQRTGCPISDDSLIPWLIEEKPDAVICITHNVNIPVILIKAQREGHLPLHTKIVVWLVDNDKLRSIDSVISEIQRKLEFDERDRIKVLNGDDMHSFSQSLVDGWFSSHSTYIVSGKHFESMLSEFFMMLRSGKHKRKKRNAPDMSTVSAMKSSSSSSLCQKVPPQFTIVAPALSISSVLEVVTSLTGILPLPLAGSSVAGVVTPQFTSVASAFSSSSVLAKEPTSTGILPLPLAGSSVPGMVTHSASSSPISGKGTLSTGILYSTALSSNGSGIVSFPTVALLASSSAVPEFGSSPTGTVSSPALSFNASGMASSYVSPVARSIPSSFVTSMGSASPGVVFSSPANFTVSRLATSQISTFAPSISSHFSSVVGSSSSSILSPSLATSRISAFLSFQLSGAVPSVSSSPVSVKVTSTIIVTSPAASSVIITSRSSVTVSSSSVVSSSSEQQVSRSSSASSSIHSVLSTSSFTVSSRLVRSSSVMKTVVLSTGISSSFSSSSIATQATRTSVQSVARSRTSSAGNSLASRASSAGLESETRQPTISLQSLPSTSVQVVESNSQSSFQIKSSRMAISSGILSTLTSRPVVSIASSPALIVSTSIVQSQGSASVQSQGSASVQSTISSAGFVLSTSSKLYLSPSSSVVPTLPPSYDNETLEIIFEGDCEDLIIDEETKKSFVQQFVERISGELNIDKKQISVDGINCGSVRVTFRVIVRDASALNVSAKLRKLVDSGDFIITVNSKHFNAHTLNVIEPTKPASLAPTTEAPMKNRIAFILYVTFGSLLGFIFLVGVIVIIMRFRRDRREGGFHLQASDYELSGFQGIPRVSNSYSRVNYYGEPIEIDATRDPREGEFEPEPEVYPYGESTSKRLVKNPDKTAEKPAAGLSSETQEDKFNVDTMGMPEWNLPKLSKSDVAVAETETSFPKSSGSVGSRKLLLDGTESPPTDAKHAFDNPGLADGDAPEEDDLDKK